MFTIWTIRAYPYIKYGAASGEWATSHSRIQASVSYRPAAVQCWLRARALWDRGTPKILGLATVAPEMPHIPCAEEIWIADRERSFLVGAEYEPWRNSMIVGD